MRSYARVLRYPNAAALLAAALVGRFPLGMVPLAIVLTVRDAGGAYSVAGLLSGAHGLGSGVLAPVLGRLADRYGQVTVLLPCGVAYAALLSLLVWLIGSRGPVPLLVAVAAVTGAVFPPLSACVRVTWSSLLSGEPGQGEGWAGAHPASADLKESAFALDSVIVELAFVSGPLLVAALQGVASPAVALLAAGGFALAGTSAFSAVPAARAVTRFDAPRLRGGALRAAGVRALLLAFGVLAVTFGVLEVGIPAFTEALGVPGAAGLLLSLLAGGSLLGGLAYGARRWRSSLPRRYLLFLLVFGLGMTLIVLPSTALGMGVALFVAGLALAPTIISAFRLIDDLAIPGTITEAFTWTQSAIVAGTALGTAVAGLLADMAGPKAALALAAVAALLAAAVAWGGRSALQPERAACAVG